MALFEYKLKYLKQQNQPAPTLAIKIPSTPLPPPPLNPLSDFNDQQATSLTDFVRVLKTPKAKGPQVPLKDHLQCGLECRCKNAMSLDGSKFVLHGAFPSLGDPCYTSQTNNRDHYYQQTSEEQIQERDRIHQTQRAKQFENKFYDYNGMPSFTELEYSIGIDLDTYVGDLRLQCSDRDRIKDLKVQVNNDPLLKNYVGCNGSWPAQDVGPKSTDIDAVTLPMLYEIAHLPHRTIHCDADVLMVEARKRVTKRRRNGKSKEQNKKYSK